MLSLMLRLPCVTLSMAVALSAPLSTAQAQVSNDNIESRRVLRAEEIAISSTVGCTVQRGCVDERLTGKCIEYHNDQWFEFTPPAAGTYYANIGGQRCRDVRGVQLVVLTGTPCRPATYRIISCTSLGTQDDLFVPLPDLHAGQPYLLDVDGYLKDYCGFTLQVSGRPCGLPVGPLPAPPAALPGPGRVVQLTWQVPDSLRAATTCRVLRRELHEFRGREIWRGAIEHDTYGQMRAAYALTDTLPGAGQYLYQIVAESLPDDLTAPPPAILQQRWVSFSELQKVGGMGGVPASLFLLLPLERYPPGATLQIVISDPATGRVLRKMPFGPGQPGNRRQVYAQDWVQAGIRKVALAITYYPPNGPATTDLLVLPLGQ